MSCNVQSFNAELGPTGRVFTPSVSAMERASLLESLFWQRKFPPPSPNIISQHLPELEGEIARHDAEIQRLKAQLSTAESSNERLKKAVEMGKSVLSPIHRMLPELLTQIFSYLREEIDVIPSTGRLQPMPVTVSMVCAQWREVALSISSLWTWMKLDFQEGLTDERIHQRVEFYLNRARTSPLKLTFRGWPPRSEPVGFRHSMAFTALCQCSPQWTSVTFEDTRSLSFFQIPAFQLVKGRLPNLRAFHIEYHRSDFGNVDSLSQNESLQSLSLEMDSDRSGVGSVLPWHQLQTLSVDVSPQHPFALNIFSMCPNLQSLELRMLPYPFEPRGFTAGLTLNISSLSLYLGHTPDTVFSRLSLPNLSSLQIHFDWGYMNTTPLLQYLTRSSPPITSFCAHNWRYPGTPAFVGRIFPLLELMPKLESLQLDETTSTTTTKFLNGLVIHRTASGVANHALPLLPNLRHLSLCFHAQELDGEALYRAVSSRWIPEPVTTTWDVVSIRSLEIIFLDDVEHVSNFPGGLTWVKDLQDEGLNVSIRHRLFK
ncbi:hypothetical protein E1B28_010743 [Marasmius oreades]|uniref:F-box domain-containing protein n=1 Tax=Marasmius oreades TaxID=181124 RepID=A0A9P7RT71_9AGAR|nr:uncharacterized protein E1B28_010743 [Marasmius oreades]KAG7089032.1 hypothetical protein E1B28_010743 [Marasmius oreades]